MKLACIQMTSRDNMAENLDTVEKLVNQAAKNGAEMVFTPENVALMPRDDAQRKEHAVPMMEHAAVMRFAAIAKDVSTWLLAGSIAVLDDDNRLKNRSILFDATGGIAATYDKIHLFDVQLPNGESHRESDHFGAGNKVVIAKTPLCNLGMSVCYDLRFPSLYQALSHGNETVPGADVIVIPAAFTKITGEAHWHTLLRARAIESQCYVVAPAQTGRHNEKRETYGHSLIIDPWGRVKADGGTEVGVVEANIDLSEIARVRQSLPSFSSGREFSF